MKQVILIVALLSFLIIPLVASANLPLQDTITQGQETINKLNDQSARDAYLKEQWADFLNKSTAGTYIRAADRQLSSLNFLWQFLLGVPFSWSFLFLFSLILWISVGTWIKRLLAFFELWDHKLHWWIGFGVATFASVLGVERTLATLAVGFTQGFNILGINPFIVQLVLELALIMGVLYLSMFTKIWEKLFLQIKEGMEQRQQKEDVKQLKQDVQRIKEETKGSGFNYTKYDIT